MRYNFWKIYIKHGNQFVNELTVTNSCYCDANYPRLLIPIAKNNKDFTNFPQYVPATIAIGAIIKVPTDNLSAQLLLFLSQP